MYSKEKHTGNETKIDILRNEIDSTDIKIIDMLCSRQQLSSKIIELKKEMDEPAYNPNREEEIKEKLKAVSAGRLDPELIEKIYSLIFEDAKK
ncbi:MAG: chorismate mutase [Chlorobi bacterium]|nr:chorismate mutase [Chlorobiota bacterium]